MMQVIFILILLALVITYWYIFLAVIMGGCMLWGAIKIIAALIQSPTPKTNSIAVIEPKKAPIAPPIPTLGLPLFWVLWTAGWAIFWLIMTFVTLDIAYTVWVVFSVLSSLPSYFWYQKRIKARAEWRRQRHVDWLFKEPLKAPGITDWEEYEQTLKVKF